MIIDRTIRPFLVYGEDPVLTALEKITANKARIVFCVGEHGLAPWLEHQPSSAGEVGDELLRQTLLAADHDDGTINLRE